MPATVIQFEEGKPVTISDSVDRIGDLTPQRSVWVDIQTDDFAELSHVAGIFGLHELTVEDCLTPGHFPKLDDYGSYLFILLRGMRAWSEVEEVWEEDFDDSDKDDEGQISYTRKVAVYLGQNFVVTFRRREVVWIDALIRQVQQNPERILREGVDGIAHRVIDVLIDRFIRSIGFFENMIEKFEDNALQNPDSFEVTELFEVKRDLVHLRQVARNQRGLISRLATDPTLVQDTQRRRYFKDIDDHAVAILRLLDKQIQSVLSIRDSYLAVANVRLGDTMRILTIITTIAAPMHLVVGLYGMNFAAIPLLDNPYGFWLVLVLMLLLGVGMLLFFRKNRWI